MLVRIQFYLKAVKDKYFARTVRIYAYINGNLYKLMEQYTAQEMKVSFLSLIYFTKKLFLSNIYYISLFTFEVLYSLICMFLCQVKIERITDGHAVGSGLMWM